MKLDTNPLDNGEFAIYPIASALLPSLAQQLRKKTVEEQRVVDTAPVNLRMSEWGDAAKPPAGKDIPAKKGKKHAIDSMDRKLDQTLRERLAEKLNRDASIIHPVVMKGLKFTRNERMKIIAAISLAEGSFVSVNKDSEFHMSKEKANKFNVKYYGVAHIGLSWGLIQFTQDSGNLGKLLA